MSLNIFVFDLTITSVGTFTLYLVKLFEISVYILRPTCCITSLQILQKAELKTFISQMEDVNICCIGAFEKQTPLFDSMRYKTNFK